MHTFSCGIITGHYRNTFAFVPFMNIHYVQQIAVVSHRRTFEPDVVSAFEQVLVVHWLYTGARIPQERGRAVLVSLKSLIIVGGGVSKFRHYLSLC